jgi:hypothetical protein
MTMVIKSRSKKSNVDVEALSMVEDISTLQYTMGYICFIENLNSERINTHGRISIPAMGI